MRSECTARTASHGGTEASQAQNLALQSLLKCQAYPLKSNGHLYQG